MKLSTKGRYAVMAMVDLARHAQAISIADILTALRHTDPDTLAAVVLDDDHDLGPFALQLGLISLHLLEPAQALVREAGGSTQVFRHGKLSIVPLLGWSPVALLKRGVPGAMLAGTDVAQPLLFKRIIDQGVTVGDTGYIFAAAATCTSRPAWSRWSIGPTAMNRKPKLKRTAASTSSAIRATRSSTVGKVCCPRIRATKRACCSTAWRPPKTEPNSSRARWPFATSRRACCTGCRWPPAAAAASPIEEATAAPPATGRLPPSQKSFCTSTTTSARDRKSVV